MQYIVCSFFGDHNMNCTEEMYSRIKRTVETLITECGVDIFLFGSQNAFELLCLKAVTELKNTYTNIRRIYVRTEYKFIDDEYKKFVAKHYDDTFCPFEARNGKRIRYMIDGSNHCVFHINGRCIAEDGTKMAYKYAKRRKKHIINLFS